MSGMTHVRTSPLYPQSNGKLERYHKTIKNGCIRPKTPLSLEDARRIVTDFVHHYNTTRLHGAIGYVTPKDKLEGREQAIFDARDNKLEAARATRRARRLGLTDRGGENTMVLAGETDVSSAGVQLTRDSRSEAGRNVERGAADSGCPPIHEDIAEILPMP